MAVKVVARERPWLWQLEEGLGRRLRSLAYSHTDKRDLRLDLLRGLAVSVMVVDHIGGDTLLTQLSGANRFIVSAAEGFVFLSGIVLGMVYGERIKKAGPGDTLRGLLYRAATLYRASVGVALFFIALYLMTDVRLWLDRSSGLGVADPLGAVVGAFTLHYSFHGSDVLVMYTLMLAVAPAIIYLLYKQRTLLVVLGSLAIWALYQRYPQQTTVPWEVAGSSFPVAAWQLLLVLGMVVGFHRERVAGWLLGGRRLSRLAVFGAGSGVYLLGWSTDLYGFVPLPADWFGDATYSSLFVKTTLGPGRVLAFLSVAIIAYTIVNALWEPLRACLGWFLLPLGQNSLYVYIMQLFVLVLLYNAAPVLSDRMPDVEVNLTVQILGLGLLWVLVRARFLFALVPR